MCRRSYSAIMFSGSGFAFGGGEVAVLVPVPVDGGHHGAGNFVELFSDAGGGVRLPSWLFRFFE